MAVQSSTNSPEVHASFAIPRILNTLQYDAQTSSTNRVTGPAPTARMAAPMPNAAWKPSFAAL